MKTGQEEELFEKLQNLAQSCQDQAFYPEIHPWTIRRIQYFMNFLIILQEQLSRVIKNNPREILIEEIVYARHLRE